MDAIGAASSVIALLQGLSASLRVAQGFHNAPKDIDSLQRQLYDFSCVIGQIERSQFSSSANPIVDRLLGRALGTLQELQALLDGPLKKDDKKGKQRLAWLWNKSKVESLRKNLHDIRANITSITNATTSASSRNLELELQTVRHLVDETVHTTARIEGQVKADAIHSALENCSVSTGLSALSQSVADGKSLQEVMLKLMHAQLQQDNLKWSQIHDTIMKVISGNPKARTDQPIPQRSQSPENHNRDEKREPAELGRPGNEISEILCDTTLESTQDQITYELSLMTTQLSSPLEESPVFFPEQYTVERLSSRISVQYLTQYQSSETRRVNKCAFFYAQTARRWRKVIAEFEFSENSRHLPVLQVSSSYPVYGLRCLPHSIHSQLEGFLDILSDGNNDTKVLKAEVSEAGSEPLFDTKTAIVTHLDDRGSPESPRSTEYLNLLQDMGCPQFSECEIATISGLHTLFASSSITHLVSLQKKVCRELMFPLLGDGLCFRNRIKRFIWELKAHYVLSGARRIVSFVGVVMDDNRSDLKGYLLEYHRPLRVVLFSNEESGGQRISWAQREKWARQTVEAVAEAHKFGIAVGGPYLWDLSVDSYGDVKLHTLRKNIPGVHDFEGYIEGNLPPEHRLNQFDIHSKNRPNPVWNTRSDLFQLGGALWQIGELEIGEGKNVFCKNAGCQNSPYIPCPSEHAHPISLTWTDEEVPPYYRRIVQFCRFTNPQQRLPAADLLLLFPPALREEKFSEEKSSSVYTFPHQRHGGVTCDICHKSCEYHYHCNICSGGDFDVCKACVAAERHCLDKKHVLLERVVPGNVRTIVLTGKQIVFAENEQKRCEEKKMRDCSNTS